LPESPFTLRRMSAGDRAWCAKSWVESYASSPMARLISLNGTLGDPQRHWRVSGEYWEDQNALVSCLLDECTTSVVVDDLGLLAGFVCWEPWEMGVHVCYIYVRLMHRTRGVAKLLESSLPRGQRYFTHRSRGLTRIPDGWTYTLRPLRRQPKAKEAA
jgi:hypothetical protein